jgi:hypothetical protein
MAPPISIAGSDVSEITIDGEQVEEVTADGDVVWSAGSSLPNSATHHYPMGEGSGTTVADAIGSNDFSLTGTSWTSDSGYNGGYGTVYDGTDDYGSASTVSALGVGKAFAVAITIDFNDIANTGSKSIIAHNRSNSDRFAVGLIQDDDGVAAGLYDGSSFQGVSSGGVSESNRYRVVYNYDGNGSGELYTNTSELTGSNSPPTSTGSAGLAIGRRLNGDLYYNGEMDDFLICDSQLSDSEIQDDYDRQSWS